MADKQQKQPEGEQQPKSELEAEEAIGATVEDGGEEPDQADMQGAGDEGAAEEDVIAQLHEDVAAARDATLRAQAEAQNAKRRAEQDVEKARKFALEQFTRDLLPVVDNLERALEAAPADDDGVKPFAEGVELTLKTLLDVLTKFNIEIVEPHGEPFDPNLHQAMSMVENNEVEPNSVIAVVQKGYTLNGRLVRPAMVMVSKNGA